MREDAVRRVRDQLTSAFRLLDHLGAAIEKQTVASDKAKQKKGSAEIFP